MHYLLKYVKNKVWSHNPNLSNTSFYINFFFFALSLKALVS